MKILAAAVTLVALLGFGATAFACSGMKGSTQASAAQSDEKPVWPDNRES
jgi:hypothetical protein